MSRIKESCAHCGNYLLCISSATVRCFRCGRVGVMDDRGVIHPLPRPDCYGDNASISIPPTMNICAVCRGDVNPITGFAMKDRGR